MDLEKLAQNHGVTLGESDNDRFEKTNDPESANLEKMVEEGAREFSDPNGEPEKPVQEEEKTKGQTETEPDVPPEVLKKWKGKSPEEIAKAHWNAEKWGKQHAEENARLKKEKDDMVRLIADLQNRSTQDATPKQVDKLEAIRKKYGNEVVEMIQEITGLTTAQPILRELEGERAVREERRQREFASYHDAYQKANPDYSENIDTVHKISTNVANYMVEFMSAAKCSKDQIDAAVHAMNYDPRMPGLVHVILRGENIDKYAKLQADQLRKREEDANNAKAEFGGGAPISDSSTTSTPKFNSTDEEWEWRKKNDPNVRSLQAFSR